MIQIKAEIDEVALDQEIQDIISYETYASGGCCSSGYVEDIDLAAQRIVELLKRELNKSHGDPSN